MKRILCLFLTFLFVLLTLAACDPNKDLSEAESKDTSSTVSSTSEEPVESEDPASKLEVKNLGGRVIRILCRDWAEGSTSITGFNGEVIQRNDFDELTADIVDIAKHEVRLNVEDKYNCKIVGELRGDSPAAFNAYVKNSLMLSKDEQFDIVFDGWGHSAPLVAEGVYVDMNTIKSINFKNPWWDQNARKDMSINNKLYWMAGDINTYDNDGTWVILFNKSLASTYYQDKDFYNMVKKDEWTLDTFIELCKGITSDINSDGILDEFDLWGFGTETYNAFVHMLASGGKIINKNNDDELELTFDTERNITVLQKIFEFYNDENTVMVANAGKFNNKGYTNVWEETIIKAFREGRELFFCCGLINIAGFRDLDFKYGFLPIPKYDTNQDGYYHSVSMHNMSAMSIPNTSTDYYDLGLVIEALGAESMKNLTPIYYEKTLKGKDADTTNDEIMLDLIFSSRTFDLGTAFNTGNVLGTIMTLNVNIASSFQSLRSQAESDLQKLLDDLNKF
ncbi:hypothetical protein LJB90_03590 [Eubacteriales bacterium OttesenSCG-928-G02]|nr:hypothetical protein [Eubacteriales bacterium OttesenSCG-928-G02]